MRQARARLRVVDDRFGRGRVADPPPETEPLPMGDRVAGVERVDDDEQ